MRASVVLPLPGGPHKMNEKSSLFSIATRRGFPTPVRCSCPTNSSRVFGLILDANGSIHPHSTPQNDLAYSPLVLRSESGAKSWRPIVGRDTLIHTLSTLHIYTFALSYRHMNIQNIIIGIVVIIVIAVGGYGVYNSKITASTT